MATTSPTLDQPIAASATTSLLISMPSLLPEAAGPMLDRLAQTFSGIHTAVAIPDASATTSSPIPIVPYTPTIRSSTTWTLTASDYLNAHELLVANRAQAVLLLGAEAQSLEDRALRRLADDILVSGCDLALPNYALPARSGLVNSAILYPISRALFGASPRFPLAIDLCLSARMAERIAAAAQRFTATNQPDALVWPVAEAATASFKISQIDAGPRTLPQPQATDLNAILAQVASSLFTDVDAKAAFWQRTRVAQVSKAQVSTVTGDAAPVEIQPMLDAFRLAYTNLLDIWSLVLPPPIPPRSQTPLRHARRDVRDARLALGPHCL